MNIDQLVNGTLISPGTKYYLKYRVRDVHGNLTLPSTATAEITPRYTNRLPAARATWTGSAVTKSFVENQWSAYPFGSTGGAVGFDNFDNFYGYDQTFDVGVSTLPFIAATPTHSFFRMPCNGTCFVEARMTFLSEASPIRTDFGVFRLGSSIPGGTATEPVVTYNFGVKEQAVALTDSTSMYINSGGDDIVKLSATVSAASGDYLTIGVYPDANGIIANNEIDAYVYYGVHQD